MVIVFAFLGVFTGGAFAYAADHLPRYAKVPEGAAGLLLIAALALLGSTLAYHLHCCWTSWRRADEAIEWGKQASLISWIDCKQVVLLWILYCSGWLLGLFVSLETIILWFGSLLVAAVFSWSAIWPWWQGYCVGHRREAPRALTPAAADGDPNSHASRPNESVNSVPTASDSQTAALSTGLKVKVVGASSNHDIETAFAAIVAERPRRAVGRRRPVVQ